MGPGRKRGGKAAAALAAAKQDWNIGDLVLAKVKGFPYWPAEISNPADWGRSTDPRKIFVYFFGTKQIGYCSVADLKPLNGEEKKKLLTKVQAKSATTDFCRAVNEILKADEKSRSENATTATTTMERFETELESKGKVSKSQDIDEQSEGKNKEPRHQQTLLEDAYETLAVHCYGVKADEKTLEGEAELEDKHVDRNAKHKLLVRTIAEAQDSKVEPEVVVLDLPKSATTSLGKANPRNTFARSVSDEQKDLAHAFAGANVRVKQDFKKKRGDSRKGSKSYTQVFKEAEDKHPSAGLETSVAGLPSEEGKLSMGKGRRFMKGNRGSFAKPELLQTARDSPAGHSDVMGFKYEGDGNEKNAARNWFSESSYDSENDGMNANLPTFYSKYKDAPVSGERHNDRNCSEALLRSSLPKKKRSATRKPERDNTESTAIQAMHTEVVSKILQNDGAQHDVPGMLSDDACGTKLKERPSRITTQQASPVEDICAPNEPECELEVDRRTDFSEGNKYMHPVKRRRAMDYYANKAVEGLSEVKEEQQCPSSIMEPITERGGKPMGDLDEHLPLVKRARARVDKDKDNLTPGLECNFNSPGKQKEEQTHVGMKEAESMKEAVSPYKIEEHSPKLEPNQKAENIPEVSESKLLSNKGTSLPLKADKYRLRSSLADGEATLPPSKRWQRAHEAMAACATEAVSAKLAEPVEKDQGPIANTNLNSKNCDNLALARNELEEKTNACDESPNDAHLTGEIAGKFVTLGARLDKINGSAWEDDNSKDVVGRFDGLSEVRLMMPQKSSTQFEKATGQDAEKVKARGKLGKKTGLEPDSHKMPNKIISNSPKKPVNVELTSSSSMGRNFESGNAIEARFDKLELQNNDKKKKMKKLVSNSGKELPSVVFGPMKHGGSERPSNVEKLSHETHHKNLEAPAKCVVSVPVDSKGLKSGKETMNAKAVSEEVITVNGGNTSISAGLYGSSKLQGEATANRVREAVAAAKVVKQRTLLKDGEVSTSSTTMKYLIAAAQARKQARTASASSFFSTVEVDKLPVALFSSPSPGNSPLADSPTQVTPRDGNRFSSVRMKSPDAALDTVQNSGHRFGDECYIIEDDSSLLSNDTEAFVARDTFEGMLETLSRTKDSIARATRHALECVKYGIAGQVVELITRKLETEPSLHRRVDLFFLVDSITQCSHQSKGDSAVAYPPAVQMLLPRIVNAAVPPGNTARENRRQCLRVLKIWLERSIMPESMLKGFINQLESKDGKSSGGLLRRSQRALDDPLREMEGMLVDEYGSNTGFSIPGLSLPRMYEDNQENSGFVKSTKDTADLVEESKEASDELQPSIEKHRHILEAVDGELEMEDVFPTTEEVRRVNIICDGEERGEYGVTKAKEFPPLPLDPPPPESPPPPLPCSPPPPPPSLPSSPPPPPPSSPPPLPSPSNHCSSSIGLHRSEQVGREGGGYCFPAATLVQDERNFEQFSQPPFNLPPLIQESSLNKNQIMGPDSAFSLSSGFMIGRTPLSQSYAIRPASSSSIPMQNASQIQSLPVVAVLSQAHYRHLTSPSPPPPPPPHPSFTYNADISCQTSSSPLVNLERPSPQISKAHGEQWIGLSSDSARRLFDDGGHFSPSDGQLPSGNSEFRLVQGGHYVCRSPCVQQQGPPQAVSEAPYANHRQQMPMVPYRGDVTSNVWRPS